MEFNQNLIEYYDELYPVTETQIHFFNQEMSSFEQPAKLLHVGCGTGYLEHNLAKTGADVTGIETSREMLESANRKRRSQLMSVRFFQMSTIEMARFLGKGFYNIVSCLDNRIVYIHDQTLMKKFFFDCSQLLAPGGKLIIELYNYDKVNFDTAVNLPVLESIRARLFTQIVKKDDGEKMMQQNLETGTGRVIPVLENTPVFPLKKHEIEEFAKKAGFHSCVFYGGFDYAPYQPAGDITVAVIS
jgi:2-polyprenyl-3-methyl-5-hydroxy-6-metoxy-1,4-benzoquinol methylase